MRDHASLAATVRLVIALNVGMFCLESAVSVAAGSVSLIADSIDFLEDASISLLVLAASGWTPQGRARLGMVLAAILLAPSFATFILAWLRLASGTPPAASALGATGLAALGVNMLCAWLLAQHRSSGGSLIRAAYLSARNDMIANLAIIAAGVLTGMTHRTWPDLSVGIAIGLLNAGAAWEVFHAARAEHRAAE